MSKVTYWYHPESESLLDPLETVDDDTASECVELSEYEYVKRKIAIIDTDPEHKLPEGVRAVIKLAEAVQTLTGKRISGMLWYDQNKRFPDGEPIFTTAIVEKTPGGLYRTKSSLYLVELLNAEESSNG